MIDFIKRINNTKNFQFDGANIMGNVIGAIVLGLVAIACFVVSYFQFNEKGFLFNNAYIYASKHERETMDKKPHYRQSGTVFIMIGIIFVLNALEMIFETDWLFYMVIAVAIIAVVYAIVSSVVIERSKK